MSNIDYGHQVLWKPMTKARVFRFTADFDDEMKPAAVQQYMEQNDADFQTATEMLGYQHGVDFILTQEELAQ